MRVLQAIYKCAAGQPSSAKDIAALGSSNGISDDECFEITETFKICLIDMPGDVSIPAYAFYRLKSGRYSICRMAFSDYTNSFLFHALILEEGHWPFYPVQAVDSSVFTHELNIDYDKFTELPILDEVPVNDYITYENISSFIKSRQDYGFGDMLSACAKYKSTSCPVVIFDEHNNLINWIAALHMAFPINMAHDISFTTFGIGFEGFMVQCTSRKGLSEVSQNSQKLVFDYRVGIKSSFTDPMSFIKIVNTGITVSKAVLLSFHKFLDMYGCSQLNEDVDGCYNLFALCSFKGLNMSRHDLKSAFDFALRYTADDMLEDTLSMMEPSMSRIIDFFDFNTADAAAEFMFKAAHASGKTVIIERTCFHFYNMLNHLVLDSDSTDIPSIIEMYSKISDLNHDRTTHFFKYPLEREYQDFILSKLNSGCTAEKAALYLYIILTDSMKLGYYWKQVILKDRASVLVDFCINNISESAGHILQILDIASANIEYLPHIAVMLYNRIKSPDIMEQFLMRIIFIMDGKDDDQRLAIRKSIMKLGTGRLLLDEYQMRLLISKDVVLFFNDYQKNVFDSIPEFSKEYLSEAIKLYVQKLPFENTFIEGMRLIQNVIDNNLMLDDAALSSLIKTFEESQNMTLPSDDVRNIIDSIKRIKKNTGIVTKPDITAMLDFAMWLESCGQTQSMDDVLYEHFEISLLDEKRYMNYINWCIPHIISFARSPEDFKRINRFLWKDGMDLNLNLSCINSIDGLIASNESKGFSILLQFSVYYFFYLEPNCKIVEDVVLPDNMKNWLINILSKQTQPFKSRFDAAIKAEFDSRKLSLPVQWASIYNEAIGKKRPSGKGFLSFLKNRRRE